MKTHEHSLVKGVDVDENGDFFRDFRPFNPQSAQLCTYWAFS
jgi:hypothetical protein